MRILLLGAGGFIGRHILAELLTHGHDVVAVARDAIGLRDAFPAAQLLSMDLSRAVRESDWVEAMSAIDIVVNTAGVLRGKDMMTVHVDMPIALQTAAARAGVERIVLISAISARLDVATDYARSKLAGEEALRNTETGWTILRPSLVYGDGSYGGTSLMRGMAALPWLIPIPGTGDFAFTPIHARDLARSVRLICEDRSFDRRTLEPVGPETLTLRDLLARYRTWLGFGSARFLPVPMPVMRVMGRLGDVMGGGPIATNSLVQMIAGNTGDSATFVQAIGFQPRSLNEALLARPAQVQDRWHARLFFLAPAIQAALVILWLSSALFGLFCGREATQHLIDALGWPHEWANALRIGSSFLDFAIAVLVLRDRTGRRATLAQLVVVLGYTVVIGSVLPYVWLDPLGPLLKNIPILLLILVHGIIGNKR